MTGPAPAVALLRVAVRKQVNDLAAGSLVLAAVSGGRDSMALAAALVFEARKLDLRAGAVIVDHGLQQDSRATAERVEHELQNLGLDPVEVVSVHVDPGSNLEAAAREARYAALDEVAGRVQAAAVLLGHTSDDQAETVLLGLARGSGARSLAGMSARRGIYRRPFLTIDREMTGAACASQGIKPWDDPHNNDERFQRVKVRHTVLPVLEQQLGPGVAEALARTAALLRDDDEALEAWAAEVDRSARLGDADDESVAGWDCAGLAQLPAAIRRRIIRNGALAVGVTPGSLRQSHLAAVDVLVTDWQGQGPVDLPGGVVADRDCGRLRIVLGRTPPPTGAIRDHGQE